MKRFRFKGEAAGEKLEVVCRHQRVAEERLTKIVYAMALEDDC